MNCVLFLHADVDECESDAFNNCHENAQCTNTEGSFTCSCNPGYTGDGVNCTSKLVIVEKRMPSHFFTAYAWCTYMHTYLSIWFCRYQ